MKYPDPLKQIVSQTRSHWDNESTRQAVRQAFSTMLECRTFALGAEIYATEEQEKTVYHTCKSPACSSCGHRANTQWQRERWAALPHGPYKAITFTMPDVLWPIFHDNPRLASALSALAAKVIQAWASAKYGLQVGVIAILQTFNGELRFNSHVHTMVTAGGLHADATWMSSIYYDRDLLMAAWRKAVIKLLRTALYVGLLRTEMALDQMENLLDHQENRWWNIKIQSLGSRDHFLRYGGRYVRRPPIAQRCISWITKETVTVLDYRQEVKTSCKYRVLAGRVH